MGPALAHLRPVLAPSALPRFGKWSVLVGLLGACGESAEVLPKPGPRDLWVTEICAKNAGGGPTAARDENGDYDDWIELYNPTDQDFDLTDLGLSDRFEVPGRHHLSPLRFPAKSYLVLFADGEAHQGPRHLSFSLDAEGERLLVTTATGAEILRFEFGSHPAGESWALQGGVWGRCASPTPGQANQCAVTPPTKKQYAPYLWPQVWPPAPAGPVVISEVGPDWIELENRSATEIDLSQVRLATEIITPPAPLPGPGQGMPLVGTLGPNQHALFSVATLSPGTVLTLGAATIFDQVSWEHPEDTVLVLGEDGLHRACDAVGATPGAPNGPCLPPPPRVAAPWLRALRSDSDFEAMASGDAELGGDARSVKFVIDRQANNALYFIDSRRWALHFEWVWEVIEGNAPFDRCTEEGRAGHATEWGRFSAQNYATVEGRRFLLGTLVHYQDSSLYTVEFAAGDRITPAMMQETFFSVAAAFHRGQEAAIRPTTAHFETLALLLEQQVPLLPLDTPFLAQTFHPLNPGLGYGVLQIVNNLDEADVSFQSIVVLDQIPNDVPLVGGTITAAPQTPLAHVNVLAQNRGTPNMSLRNATQDPQILALEGSLVRFEVRSDGYDLRVATATEAETFWRARTESRPRFAPPRNLGPRALLPIERVGIFDLDVVGAKAAQFGELAQLDWRRWTPSCVNSPVDARLPVPLPAFALPFSRYVDHLAQSGAADLVIAALTDPDFARDPVLRKTKLAEIRSKIEAHPVDPELLATLEQILGTAYGSARFRLRSSTNVEDLVGFNGAGLYESHSAQLTGGTRDLAEALKKVWASTFTFRAFEERRLFNVDENRVAMGVLIHPGFPNEEANGVAITTNVIDPRGHGYYLNSQVGEISVVSPEGHIPEQMLVKLFNPAEEVVLARSSVTRGEPILSPAERDRLICILRAVHFRFREHYQAIIEPDNFAVDVEWKVVGADRRVILKQARPWIRPQLGGQGPGCE